MGPEGETARPPRKWVGARVKRREDLRFLTGRGSFIDDVKLPGTLHAAILRSPYAHAKIKKTNTTKALTLRGVVATLTGEEVARTTKSFLQIVPPPADKMLDYCMAVDKVRFAGEPVAVVVAEDKYTAEDALDLIEVEYEPLPVILDAEEAMGPNAPLVHEEVGSNVIWHEVFHYGDINKAFQEADETIGKKLHFHRFSSTPMENNGVIADYEASTEQLTIWCNNQMPMFCLPLIALALGIPSDKIRIKAPDIGGGFGIKIISYTYMVLLSLLSIKTGRPVKWTETRREHLAASAHGNEVTVYAEAAAKRDGTILGMKVRTIHDEGAYTRYEPVGALLWIQVSPGCYRFKNLLMDVNAVVTNKCPVGPNRGYGRMQHMFVLERMMNFVAKKLNLNPIDVRMKNYILPHEMPYTTPSGCVYDGGDYPEALRKALQMIDYDAVVKKQELLRREGRFVGVGVGSSLDSGTNNFGQVRLIYDKNPFSGTSEAALVKIDEMGKVIVALGTVPQGQSHETVLAQVVADELGVSPEEVNVLPWFDSQTHPYTGHSGTYASRFAAAGTGAAVGAARKLKDKVIRIAAHMLDTTPEHVELADGKARVKGSDRSVAFWEIGNVAWRNNVLLPEGEEPGLMVTHVYKPDFKLPDSQKRGNFTLTYSYQTHVGVVEVDVETGKVNILKYAAIDDCGTVLNPMVVEGQVQGAAAHGIGAALFETFKYDENGQLLTSTFMDYLVPSAVDVPHVEVDHMETPSPFAPLGAKGVGEGGGTPLAAIANAVEDALSPFAVELTSSHNTPEEIFTLIRKRTKG